MSAEMLMHRVQSLVSEFGTDREKLLPVLEVLDREFYFLNEMLINEVARLFQLSQTEVYSVASFYHLLNVKPAGKFVIHICRTICCELKGKNKIVQALEAELGIKMGETTPDHMFTLKYANCMGMCDAGPAMLINSDLHANLTPSRAVKILQTYIKSNENV